MIPCFQMYEDSSGVTLMTEDRTAVMEYSRPVKKWFGYVTINLYVMIERKEGFGVAWRSYTRRVVRRATPYQCSRSFNSVTDGAY